MSDERDSGWERRVSGDHDAGRVRRMSGEGTTAIGSGA
jgi:hypothetical protein